MEKYFVVRVKFLKDGSAKPSEVMEYSTQKDAIAKFHWNLQTDMKDETLCGSTCVVINAYGGVLKQEHWEDAEQIQEAGE